MASDRDIVLEYVRLVLFEKTIKKTSVSGNGIIKFVQPTSKCNTELILRALKRHSYCCSTIMTKSFYVDMDILAANAHKYNSGLHDEGKKRELDIDDTIFLMESLKIE